MPGTRLRPGRADRLVTACSAPLASQFSFTPRPGPVGTLSIPSSSSLNGGSRDLLDVRHAGLVLDPARDRQRRA